MGKIKKYYQENKIIYNVFILVFVIKFAFFIGCNITITPDSKEYIGINGFDIFTLQLNEYRVPIYPLFIEIFESIFKENALIVVTYIQLAISFISSIYLFKTFNIFSKKTYVNLFITFIYSCSTVIMGWDKTILTESFALSFTIFLIYNLINYLKYKKIKYVINITILTGVGTFMRPTFMLYSIIIFGFFILRFMFLKKERVISIKSLLISSVSVILILLYSSIFYQQYDKFSLSNSLLGQQITVMAQTGLYKLGNDKEIIDVIDSVAKNIEFKNKPYLARFEVMKLYDRKRISNFIKEIKQENIISYSKEIIKITFNELNVAFGSYYSGNFLIRAWGSFIYRFNLFISFGQGILIAAICLVILLYKIIKKKLFDWIYFGIFGFITLTYVTSILGTNAEYQRTAITSLPFITLAVYLFIINIIDFIKKSDNEKITGSNSISNLR